MVVVPRRWKRKNMLQYKASPGYNAVRRPIFNSDSQKKHAKNCRRPASIALDIHGYHSLEANHVQMVLETIAYMPTGLSDVFHSPQLTVRAG
ncbi:hypothetical protein AVEN_60244-1 [Araneus ventricosus]|uniref:Uncharacterized protein n=1 Tax=Araneus ventricosus TaxID=182803 RepID=A0A4Y2TJ20_ARAVE|nr:hypothetical protein AVEN_60244-1 [Araneus ventricosus]